jgi:hypothetical protein
MRHPDDLEINEICLDPGRMSDLSEEFELKGNGLLTSDSYERVDREDLHR